MKAATTHSRCTPGHSPASGAGERRAMSCAHTPRRTPRVSWRCDAPRLTAPAKQASGQGAPQVAPWREPEVSQRNASVPRVLLIDSDSATAHALTDLLAPEAQVVHVPTLSEARRQLMTDIFSLVVMDPGLPDGDAGSLMAVLTSTPVLVYSERQPAWRHAAAVYLPKPWTSPRQLWSTISQMLGVPASMSAGD